MGNKSCCKSSEEDVKPSTKQIQKEEQIEANSFTYVNISCSLMHLSDSECFFKKQFDSKKVQLKDLILKEKSELEKIDKFASQFNCLPKLIRLNMNTEDPNQTCLYFSCNKYQFLKLLNSNKIKILEKLLEHLKENLKEIFEAFIQLKSLNIHHLNFNPSNIYLSNEGNIKVLNFIFPEIYNEYDKANKTAFDNCFLMNNQKIFWNPPEVDQKTSYNDKEKIDVFAIGKFINLILGIEKISANTDRKHIKILTKLSEKMISENPESRPTLAECLGFLEFKPKNISKLIDILRPDGSCEIIETSMYICRNSHFEYFGYNFEKREITIKTQEASAIIQEYIDKMKVLSHRSNSKRCFLKIYSVHQEENNFTILTDYYKDSFDISIKENRNQFNSTEIWDIFMCLLRAFDIANDLEIVHGNICPRNLLISPDGKVKIYGFLIEGKSILKNRDRIIQIQTNEDVVAPELLDESLAEDQDLDLFKSDSYCFGVTWLQIVANRYIGKSVYYDSEEIRNFIDSSINFDSCKVMKTILSRMLDRVPENRLSIREYLKNPSMSEESERD